MTLIKRQFAKAVAMVGLLGGWFGAGRDMRPKDFTPESEVTGYRGSGYDLTAAGRNARRTRSKRHRVGYGRGHRRRYMQHDESAPYVSYQVLAQLPDTVNGRGSEWIKENRRRRAYGLPQRRLLPFGLGIYNPLTGYHDADTEAAT